MTKISAGVQILIDQLTNNPDEFFGPLVVDPRIYDTNPKFVRWCGLIEEASIGLEPCGDGKYPASRQTWFMTDEEKAALRDAYLAAKRQRFDAEIIAALHAKPKEASFGTPSSKHTLPRAALAGPAITASWENNK